MRLFLHVGWAKTGTSAIQNFLHDSREHLLRDGILYPSSIQRPDKWGDHSHHEFALSLRPTGGLKADLAFSDMSNLLLNEINTLQPKSVLISSELSPFYFEYPEFNTFLEQTFSTVTVIFTVRRQSELLLSFYNQVIKDYSTHYSGSIFELFVKHIAWMNFFENIKMWSSKIGHDNIRVVPYMHNIVCSFLRALNLEEGLYSCDGPEKRAPVNQSVPNQVLGILRMIKANGADEAKYQSYVRALVDNPSKLNDLPSVVLYSASEQKNIDQYFQPGNTELARRYLKLPTLFGEKVYSDVVTIMPPRGEEISRRFL